MELNDERNWRTGLRVRLMHKRTVFVSLTIKFYAFFSMLELYPVFFQNVMGLKEINQ